MRFNHAVCFISVGGIFFSAYVNLLVFPDHFSSLLRLSLHFFLSRSLFLCTAFLSSAVSMFKPLTLMMGTVFRRKKKHSLIKHNATICVIRCEKFLFFCAVVAPQHFPHTISVIGQANICICIGFGFGSTFFLLLFLLFVLSLSLSGCSILSVVSVSCH